MIQQPSTELPSLKNTLLQPKILLIIVAIGAVLNVLFISTTIYFSSNQTVINTTPVVQPTPTGITQPTKAVTPTKSEAESEGCFVDCKDDEFLTKLESTLKTYTYVKSAISYFNYTEDTCYGEMSSFDTPNKELQKEFLPQNCLPNDGYDPYKITYRIDNSSYYYDNDNKLWEQGTSGVKLQLSFFDVINELKRQQSITSTLEGQYRIFTGTSDTFNDDREPTTKTITIYVDNDFKVVYYKSTAGDDYTELGSFFDYGIPNNIVAPK